MADGHKRPAEQFYACLPNEQIEILYFQNLRYSRIACGRQVCFRALSVSSTKTQTWRGGAAPQREGFSLCLGAPSGGGKLRGHAARRGGRLPAPRRDCRKIPTFVARISQTARDAGVICLGTIGGRCYEYIHFSLVSVLPGLRATVVWLFP